MTLIEPADLPLFAPLTAPLANAIPEGVPHEICAMFERIAMQAKSSGVDRYSARAIFHRMRWEEQIEKGNREFKINNLWSAPLARWLMAKHPSMKNFFETRESSE